MEGLETVRLPKTILTIGTDGATLHVPYGCRDKYSVTPWTGWFANIVDDATQPPYDHADVNHDTKVDVADIASVISAMANASSQHAASADVNGDGKVDVADIASVIIRMAQLARMQRD